MTNEELTTELVQRIEMYKWADKHPEAIKPIEEVKLFGCVEYTIIKIISIIKSIFKI